MKPGNRRFVAAGIAGLVMLGAIAAIPENTVLFNHSRSMALGWYVRVPFAEVSAGSIVAFPIPDKARAMADEAGIEGSLLKRVFYRDSDGDLYLAGDFGGDRSFDSRWYGAIPEASIMGVYKLVVKRDPGSGVVRKINAAAWKTPPTGGFSAKEVSNLTDPGEARVQTQVDPSRNRELSKW